MQKKTCVIIGMLTEYYLNVNCPGEFKIQKCSMFPFAGTVMHKKLTEDFGKSMKGQEPQAFYQNTGAMARPLKIIFNFFVV